MTDGEELDSRNVTFSQAQGYEALHTACRSPVACRLALGARRTLAAAADCDN